MNSVQTQQCRVKETKLDACFEESLLESTCKDLAYVYDSFLVYKLQKYFLRHLCIE